MSQLLAMVAFGVGCLEFAKDAIVECTGAECGPTTFNLALALTLRREESAKTATARLNANALARARAHAERDTLLCTQI